MGLWICFPRLKRCCFCTRKLRAACVLICIFIMFAGAHGFAMFMSPSCTDMFDEDNEGDLLEPLVLVMWFFLPWSLLLLVSNFFFFLAIFKVPRQCLRYVARDFLVFCGLVWAGLAIALANLQLLHMVNCDCNNHSDIIACFVYTPCMLYYMIIVNSYKDLKGKNDTVLEKVKKKPKKPKKEPTTKVGKCMKATRELIGRLFYYKRKGKKNPKTSKIPKAPKTPKTSKTPKPPKEPKPPKKSKSPKEPRSPKSSITPTPPQSPKEPKPPKKSKTPTPPRSPKPSKTPKEKKDKKNRESDTKTAVTTEVAATPVSHPAAATDTAALTPTEATEAVKEVAAELPSDTAKVLNEAAGEMTPTSSTKTAPTASPSGKEPPALTPGEALLPSPPVKAPSASPPVNAPATTPPSKAP